MSTYPGSDLTVEWLDYDKNQIEVRGDGFGPYVFTLTFGEQTLDAGPYTFDLHLSRDRLLRVSNVRERQLK